MQSCGDLRAIEAIHTRYTGAVWKAEFISVPGGGATLGVGMEHLCLGYMELGFCLDDHRAEGTAGLRGDGPWNFD